MSNDTKHQTYGMLDAYISVGRYAWYRMLLWPTCPGRRLEPQPTIFGESGATRSAGPGVAAARRVRIARATPSFTNRTSVVSPSWFVLLRRTVTSTPSTSAASSTSAQWRALTSLRRIPAMAPASARCRPSLEL